LRSVRPPLFDHLRCVPLPHPSGPHCYGAGRWNFWVSVSFLAGLEKTSQEGVCGAGIYFKDTQPGEPYDKTPATFFSLFSFLLSGASFLGGLRQRNAGYAAVSNLSQRAIKSFLVGGVIRMVRAQTSLSDQRSQYHRCAGGTPRAPNSEVRASNELYRDLRKALMGGSEKPEAKSLPLCLGAGGQGTARWGGGALHTPFSARCFVLRACYTTVTGGIRAGREHCTPVRERFLRAAERSLIVWPLQEWCDFGRTVRSSRFIQAAMGAAYGAGPCEQGLRRCVRIYFHFLRPRGMLRAYQGEIR